LDLPVWDNPSNSQQRYRGNEKGDKMNRIRVGIAGCGNIGGFHAKVLREVEGAVLQAVADTNFPAAEKLAGQYGCAAYASLTDLLDKGGLDLLSVCLPPALHYEAAIAAADRGIHVLMEKPMDISGIRAARVIEHCKNRGVKLGVVSQHRFDPVVQILKGLIGRNRLGKLLMGTAKVLWYRGPEYYRDAGTWRGQKSHQAGALMNQSIHYIDLLQYLMGGVEAVQSVCRTLSYDIEVEDTGLALLRFKNGAIGSIEATTIAYPGLMAELNIYAEKATVSVRDDRLAFYYAKDGPIPELDALLAGKSGQAAVTDPLALDTKGHVSQYLDMIDAINNNREPVVTGEEGRLPLVLIETIYLASEKENWTPL
jgi:predicted dehydrogenase